MKGPAIRLVYAGGTIGAAGSPLAPMPADRFSDLWERHLTPHLSLPRAASWSALEPAIDSSEASPADWARLARGVLAALAEGEDAVVVLHGTDTLASAAAALAFLATRLDGPRPTAALARQVILTGAQRPLFRGDGIASGTDALRNVEGALSLAALPPVPGRAVSLCFGGAVLPGTRAEKVSTTADLAFAAPNGTPDAAAMAETDPAALLADLDGIAPHLGKRVVLTIHPGPNPDGALAAQIAGAAERLGDRLGAVLLLGYGLGNLPERATLEPVLAGLVRRGIAVMVGTQVPAGGAEPGAYAAGHWALGTGAISAGDMTVAAAQAKLHVGLALAARGGWDAETLRTYLSIPIAGELGR